MLKSWFIHLFTVYLHHSNNPKNNIKMKDQMFTSAQKIAALIVITLFLIAVLLAKLNVAGFNASQFTNL